MRCIVLDFCNVLRDPTKIKVMGILSEGKRSTQPERSRSRSRCTFYTSNYEKQQSGGYHNETKIQQWCSIVEKSTEYNQAPQNFSFFFLDINLNMSATSTVSSCMEPTVNTNTEKVNAGVATDASADSCRSPICPSTDCWLLLGQMQRIHTTWTIYKLQQLTSNIYVYVYKHMYIYIYIWKHNLDVLVHICMYMFLLKQVFGWMWCWRPHCQRVPPPEFFSDTKENNHPMIHINNSSKNWNIVANFTSFLNFRTESSCLLQKIDFFTCPLEGIVSVLKQLSSGLWVEVKDWDLFYHSHWF